MLKVAIIGEPPSLDAHWTTASLTYDVTSHLYEPLFTLDGRYGMVPMLAEGHTGFYDWMYKSALAAKQQLEDVGFNIDLRVLEWATVVQRRNNPKLYEIFTTGIGFQTDPSQLAILSCDWPGWTCDPKLDTLQSRLACETDFARRKAVWEEIQRWFWDEVPVVKLGDFFTLRIKQKSVAGYANRYRPFFWNVGLKA